MTRRQFLAASASTALASARTLSTIGVQLYTVRSVLPEKPLETLKAIERLGFREVEVVGATLPKIWPDLKQTALKPVSCHLDTALFTKRAAELPAALDDAAQKGFRFVVCPYIAPQDRGGVDVMLKLAETLNRAGEKCRASGLTLAYHNHAFEFEPAKNSNLLGVLLDNTDKKNVQLELDVFWAAVAGADPVKLLKQHRNRVPLVHLKDVKRGAQQRLNEQVPRDTFYEVGSGSLDFEAILKAASASGVQHYFVEQDQTPGDPLDSLKKSIGFLQTLQF